MCIYIVYTWVSDHTIGIQTLPVEWTMNGLWNFEFSRWHL